MKDEAWTELCQKIDDLVGAPEDESEEDREKRHQMMRRDSEKRALRKAAGVPH